MRPNRKPLPERERDARNLKITKMIDPIHDSPFLTWTEQEVCCAELLQIPYRIWHLYPFYLVEDFVHDTGIGRYVERSVQFVKDLDIFIERVVVACQRYKELKSKIGDKVNTPFMEFEGGAIRVSKDSNVKCYSEPICPQFPEKEEKDILRELKVSMDQYYSMWQTLINSWATPDLIKLVEGQYLVAKKEYDERSSSLVIHEAKDCLFVEKENVVLHSSVVDYVEKDVVVYINKDDVDEKKDIFVRMDAQKVDQDYLDRLLDDALCDFYKKIDQKDIFVSDCASSICNFETRIEECVPVDAGTSEQEKNCSSLGETLNDNCYPSSSFDDVLWPELVVGNFFEDSTLFGKDEKVVFKTGGCPVKPLGEIFGLCDVENSRLLGGGRSRKKILYPCVNSTPEIFTSFLYYQDSVLIRESSDGYTCWNYTSDLFTYKPFENEDDFGEQFGYYSSLYEKWKVKSLRVMFDFKTYEQPVNFLLAGYGDEWDDLSSYDSIKSFDPGLNKLVGALPVYGRVCDSFQSFEFEPFLQYGDRNFGHIDKPPDKVFGVCVLLYNPIRTFRLCSSTTVKLQFEVEWSVPRTSPLPFVQFGWM